MSQSDFGTINPNSKSGTALATDLNDFRDALHSMHSGSSRPSYVAAGMMWANTTSATEWIINLYDGTDDIIVGKVDTTNNRMRFLVDADGDTYLQRGTTDDEVEVVVAGSVVGKFTASGWVPTTPATAQTSLGGTTVGKELFTAADAAAARTAIGVDFASVGEDIIPDTDSTRDLGSATKAFALAFLDAIEPVGADTTIKRVGGTNTTPIVDGMAKAWANLKGTGTIEVRDSSNVASATDNGPGDYTLTYTAAMANTNYSGDTNSFTGSIEAQGNGPIASYLTVNIRIANYTGGSFIDRDVNAVSVHGDLA